MLQCEGVRTAIGPEYDVILRRIVSTLEKVEEDMSRLDVDVTCVRTSRKSSRIPAGPYV